MPNEYSFPKIILLFICVTALAPALYAIEKPARPETRRAGDEKNEEQKGQRVAAPAQAAAIPDAALAPVRDLTEGIREEEREAYFAVLDHARTVSPKGLNAAAARTLDRALGRFNSDPKNARKKFSLFGDIVRHPQEYRGQPVRLHGYIRRIETFEAGENDQGFKTLHQAWLFTEDSLGNPYVVICSDLPPNLPNPKKGSPTNDIAVTGYFFKLWSFQAERGNWGAPLILAGRLEWNPPPPPLSATLPFKLDLGGALLLLFATVTVVIVRRTRLDRAFRDARRVGTGLEESPFPLLPDDDLASDNELGADDLDTGDENGTGPGASFPDRATEPPFRRDHS
jgi:hypothetical protein